jgi:dCTP deaminase
MILSDKHIREAILEKKILIDPPIDFDTALSACSIDLKLHHEFCVFDKNGTLQKINVNDGEKFILQPGQFALASTLESVKIPDDMAARLEGRSSMARLGIIVHSTASLIDPGFIGQITLELANLGPKPVILEPGMRICALSFETLSGEAETPYHKKKNAKYLHQSGPTGSKIVME